MNVLKLGVSVTQFREMSDKNDCNTNLLLPMAIQILWKKLNCNIKNL